VTRTSLDMELDLQASQTRLVNLQDENSRLRDLKKKIEEAKARGLFKFDFLNSFQYNLTDS